MSSPNYKTVDTAPSGNSGGPLILVLNLKKKTTIEGQYIGTGKLKIANKDSTKYVFKLLKDVALPLYDKETEETVETTMKAGEEISLVGVKELNDAIPSHPFGTFFRLVYEGKKQGKNNNYHHFSIGADESGSQNFQPVAPVQDDEGDSTASKIEALKSKKAIA